MNIWVFLLIFLVFPTTTPSNPPPSTIITSTTIPTSTTATPPLNYTTTNSTSAFPTTVTAYQSTTRDIHTTTPPTTTRATTTTTTSSTTSTPPSTTPLLCLNGGVLVSGVCVCPDEWSGNTCSVGNFCEAEVLGKFRFPSTPVGWFAYSTDICPKGTSNAGKPKASTRCSTKKGLPSFDSPPQELQCDQTLSEIRQNLTSAADLETLASSTQILTSRPEELTAGNVRAAAHIVNTLLLSPNATESVRVAAVATVSQLLNASVPDTTEEDNTTLGLTLTLDQLSVNLSSSLNASQSQVVQPNLVVQSAQIPAADTQGVQNVWQFCGDRIQLNTNTSTVVVDNGFIADALIYISFPSAATSRQQNISLGFVLYQNDRFFRSRLYRRHRASLRVLSASVRGLERSVVPQHVEMMFRPTMMNGTSLYDFACVFWNYSLDDWSTAGCSKGNASGGVLTCFCNHTTNFAALWSFTENYEYAEALGVISIVGLSVSVVCLVVTIIYHIKEKILKGGDVKSQITQLFIFVSLLAFIITFLSGVENSNRQDDAQVEVNQTNIIPDSDEHVDPDRGSCTAVAALLHFFLLATFMWSSLYGTLLLLVGTMKNSLHSHWIPVSLATGYGVPAVMMAITLAATYSNADPLEYRQEEFCWLAALDKSKNFDFSKPMFWGFVLPVGLILMYNILMFVLISIKGSTSCCSKKFLRSFSLVVILGLSWTLGYLVLVTKGVAHLVLSILFCLLTATQGIQIFFLITFKQLPSVRTVLTRSAQYISSVSIPLNNLKATTTTTTSSTTSTPPSTTPLLCLNGGVLVSGVCVCPDEWSGNTCSVGNFCEAEVLGKFRFPSTPVGWFAYSTEICPKGTSNAGKPKASTRCSTKKGLPSFDSPPQELQCDQTLTDIQQNLTSAADLETLASSTQILTSRPEELTAENVTAAAHIVNTLLLSPNATEGVRVAAVATVSQLLNASVPDTTEENDATLSLTLTLDQLSMNLSSSLNASQSQVVQPNLVVQSAQVPAVDTQGVQFTSLTGTSGSFVENRTQLNTNTSKAVVENGFIADALIYIRFPAAAGRRQQPSNVSLGFVLYQNDRFFRSRLYRRRRASVRVLSASLRSQERSLVPQHVEMSFRPSVMNGTSLYDFACVFWNYSLDDWSTAGCSKGNASGGVLTCFCNHTTNFAALWSFREKYEYAEPLGVISIVGLSLSIVGLIITIIHHIKVNFLRKSHEQQNLNSKLTLLCIYVSLLAFIITFLSGVNNPSRQDDAQAEMSEANIIPDFDEHVDPDRGSCSAVAALLHFFLLATFMWNSVYGTQLLLLIRTMQRSLSSYWTLLSFAVGWGAPAVIMAITLGATYSVDNPLGYRQEEFCWLAALSKDKQFHFGKPLFWGFVLPVGLILIYNIVLLVLVSLTTCRKDPKLTSGFVVQHPSVVSKEEVPHQLLSGCDPGSVWTLGYLVLASTGNLHLVFSILFCLCTTTQGFQIFILFTARTPAFRAAVSRSFQYVSSVNIPLRTTRYSFSNSNWDTSSRTESYRDLRD
ncbi:hypothetical protein Q5P01_005979 [Channa striata]|uniref:Adhesion G-protein coupled receptor G7 n=1 Tax=Channa striata TaxID=64152 RepID=A0AA88T001_CHASR|nr:hypothetical protein Q5P01_005979 [Channa striata]